MAKKRKKRENNPERRFFPLPKKVKKIILVTIFLLLAVIIIFSFFGESGPAGNYLREVLTKGIGGAFFSLPLLFFLISLIIIKSRYKRLTVPTVVAALLIIVSISGVLEIWPGKVGQGGIIGRVFGTPFQNLFDFWIALFIFLTFFIAGSLITIQLLKIPSELREAEPKKGSLAEKFFKKIIGQEKEFKVTKVDYNEEFKELKKEMAKEETVKEKPKAKASEKNFLESKAPPSELLEVDKGVPSSGDIKVNSAIIKKTLEDFSIPVEMSGVRIGPTVTQYTLKPAEGIKLSKITSLVNDLSLSLAAQSIRIEAPIPGKALVGVEVPNKVRSEVRLRNLVENSQYKESLFALPLIMGQGVSGEALYSYLEKMPHLLVAGATGSGKTIFLNILILSLLLRNTPQKLRLILVDPKRVEFGNYEELPHLLCPVIFDVNRACNALKWLIGEMERRLKIIAEIKSRDIESYNKVILKNNEKKNGEKMEILPYIVLVIDELADLMAAKGRDIEAGIVRLAQMARATGIHLILATQRPSVEVITGLIKANIITRVAFQVASQVDSRTILDMAGAEKLLGRGDLLFISGEISKPKRIQSPYVTEEEIRKVVKWLKIEYNHLTEDNQLRDDLENKLETLNEEVFNFSEEDDDPLYNEAKNIVVEAKKASASFLQRRLKIGYARAARLIDLMEERGVVGPGDGAKAREIYSKEDENGEKWQKL